MNRKPNRRTASLDYIQNMLRELRTIAYSERCEILAYMIEMAYVECSDVIRGDRPLRPEFEEPESVRHRQAV